MKQKKNLLCMGGILSIVLGFGMVLAVSGCKLTPVDNGESFTVRIATSQNGTAVTTVTAGTTIYAVLGDFVNLDKDSTTDNRNFELFVNGAGKDEELVFANSHSFDLSSYGVTAGDTIQVKVRWADLNDLATAESPTVTVTAP